eukprot:5534860-Amphidinium_carterae.1
MPSHRPAGSLSLQCHVSGLSLKEVSLRLPVDDTEALRDIQRTLQWSGDDGFLSTQRSANLVEASGFTER